MDQRTINGSRGDCICDGTKAWLVPAITAKSDKTAVWTSGCFIPKVLPSGEMVTTSSPIEKIYPYVGFIGSCILFPLLSRFRQPRGGRKSLLLPRVHCKWKSILPRMHFYCILTRFSSPPGTYPGRGRRARVTTGRLSFQSCSMRFLNAPRSG